MDGKRARLIDPTLDHPTIPAAPQAPARADMLSQGWAAVLGLGWPLVVLAMLVLEPVPDNPDAGSPALATIVWLAFFAGLLATSVMAGARQRMAAPVSVVTGLIGAAMVVSCPVSGHHTLAAWWFAESAVLLAMLGVSAVALRQVFRR